MSTGNCDIPHTLYNFWLLTSASPTYALTYHIPLGSILYSRGNEVHSRIITCCNTRAVNIKQSHYLRIYFQKCYYMFVNVCKVTSYAIGKLIAASSNGLLLMIVFIVLQFYYDHRYFCKANYLLFFYTKY